MAKELDSIDTSSFRSLAEIRQDELALEGLIQRAQDEKAAVSSVVFERVAKDYTARLQALEARAQPLRVSARAELKKLHAVRDHLKAALDLAVTDHDELKFRLKVGELQKEEFEPRDKTLSETLAAAQQAFDEVEKVCKQFADVVPLEPLPAAAASPSPTAPPEPPPAPTPAQQRADAPLPAAKPAPPSPAVEEGEQESPTIAGSSKAVPGVLPEFVTMNVSLARLVEQTESGPPKIHGLSALTTIGRVAENDISMDRPEVSRNHAKIVVTDAGVWIITDLGSGNGSYVNGTRIKEQALKHGDHVRIGTTEFVFEAR